MILTDLTYNTHFSALRTSHKNYTKYFRAARPFLLSVVISDFLLDIWILGLPIPQVSICILGGPRGKTKFITRFGFWTIDSTIRRKVAVTGVFLLAFALVASTLF